MTTFESVLAHLARARVDFFVVGGLAVAQAGFARFTDDLDVLVEPSPSNIERLIEALSGVGEGYARELTPEDFPLEEGCVRIQEDFAIDVFTQMSGYTFSDLLPLTEPRPVLGEQVRFLSAEGLIRLKAPSLRDKDKLDVQVLRRLQRERGA